VEPTLRLRPGKDRSLLRRHPWVYSNAVASVEGRPGAGETVRIEAADGRFLAWAAFSPESTIRARCWTFAEGECPDTAWLAGRIAAAARRRQSLRQRTEGVRIVAGEGDGLPGLIVDQYRDRVVLQFLAAGVEARRDELVGLIRDAIRFDGQPCAAGYERSDAAVREREGLNRRQGPLWGTWVDGARVPMIEDGIRYEVDVVGGHKTGFYLDQRDNRRLARSLAEGARVLNAFCYTGGFSLAALAGGAVAVRSVDSSADALAIGRCQLAANGLDPTRAEWIASDVFDDLKAGLAAGAGYELIVLDPPKFAPSARHVDRAARAYKEINLKALRLLARGGHLMTFSCSGAISVDLFQKIVAGAVIDSGRDVQMIGRLSAATDHPVAMTHPEGEYLKGLLLAAV
jgi:23S rRNA (cytosine1962-C5)-methyltransferase